jgi:hypothetical protein
MSKDLNVSDVQPQAAINPNVTPTSLPIRGEKRIIPTPVSPSDLNLAFQNLYTKSGAKLPKYKTGSSRTQLVQGTDFETVAALSPYTDYVKVRLLHRGTDASGNASAAQDAVYSFLVNPNQMQVTRSTLDEQSMTRGGWQIGVWGEDSVQITLSGKTAGQYWSFGLTDQYQQYTESYRNLMMLQMVFENNGYWFEGEQLNEGPLAADFLRRRIKMHSDVQLTVGNFVWYGMFDSLTISQSADEPYLMNFNLSFVAWKERFRSSSPYQNQITTELERGHSYGSWNPSVLPNLSGIPANSRQPIALPPPTVTPPAPTPAAGTPLPASTPITSAAQQSAANNNTLAQTTNPAYQDWTPSPSIKTFNGTLSGVNNG